jgi:hypothetical protein
MPEYRAMEAPARFDRCLCHLSSQLSVLPTTHLWVVVVVHRVMVVVVVMVGLEEGGGEISNPYQPVAFKTRRSVM